MNGLESSIFMSSFRSQVFIHCIIVYSVLKVKENKLKLKLQGSIFSLGAADMTCYALKTGPNLENS